MLDRIFSLNEHAADPKNETLAGITTFLTMSYSIFVNPQSLSETGLDWGIVFVATCLAAPLDSILVGLLANDPTALTPSMELNANFCV
ncbi:MAG: hypothetical protein VYA34_09290 [Myxococcota bacterium]|nr:hypothetical protein [Myxococcota bacterium]